MYRGAAQRAIDGRTGDIHLEKIPTPSLPGKNSIIDRSARIYPTAKITDNCECQIAFRCLIGDYAFISVSKLIMEEGAQIAPHAILSGGGTVIMRRHSCVGFGTQLITGTDTPEAEYMSEAGPPDKRKIIRGTITLGERAYVGSGAIVCVSKRDSQIIIGDRTVVGALTYIDRSLDKGLIVHPTQILQIKARV